MWFFKSSSLLFLCLLLFCCINVSTARNLRQSEQQKLPDHGMMESGSNTSNDQAKLQKDEYDFDENEEPEKEVLATDYDDQLLIVDDDGYGNGSNIPAKKLTDNMNESLPSGGSEKQAYGRFRRDHYNEDGKVHADGMIIPSWLVWIFAGIGIFCFVCFCGCSTCIGMCACC